MRKDHAGWVEVNNEVLRRIHGMVSTNVSATPFNWVAKLGGPPPGIAIGDKGYAVHTEVYDIPLLANRAAAVVEREYCMDRAARGRAMMAEQKKNLEKEKRQYEDDMAGNGLDIAVSTCFYATDLKS
jgi:hypothetical protein